jgi:hypothetical protein
VLGGYYKLQQTNSPHHHQGYQGGSQGWYPWFSNNQIPSSISVIILKTLFWYVTMVLNFVLKKVK